MSRRLRDELSCSSSDDDAADGGSERSERSRTDGWQTDEGSEFTQDELDESGSDDCDNGGDEEENEEARALREVQRYEKQCKRLAESRKRKQLRSRVEVKPIGISKLFPPLKEGGVRKASVLNDRFVPLRKKMRSNHQ